MNPKEESNSGLYTILVEKHGIKMKVLVAVQRKILELTFILWKNKTEYKAVLNDK